MSQVLDTEGFWGVDSYFAFAFPLNSDGSLQAPDTDPYEGKEIDGTRNFNLTPAEGSLVVNIGNGRLRDTIYRAPREASRAELTIGYTQPALKAALQGSNTYSIGEALFNGRLTNLQGSEPDVAFVVVQRGHNDNGLTRYRAYFVPKSRIIPRDSPLNDNASEETLQIVLSNTKKQVWGKSFTVGLHGFTDATYEEAIFEGAPKVVAWLAAASEDTFLLPTDKPAISTSKLNVFRFSTGVEYVGGITKGVTQIEFDYPPSAGLLVGLYEYQP